MRARRPQSRKFFRERALVVEAMEAELPPVEERRRLREELSEFVESCRRTLEEVTASLGWSLDRLEPGEEAAAAEVRGPRGRGRRAGRGVCRAKVGRAGLGGCSLPGARTAPGEAAESRRACSEISGQAWGAAWRLAVSSARGFLLDTRFGVGRTGELIGNSRNSDRLYFFGL